jgi:hypothetical protein
VKTNQQRCALDRAVPLGPAWGSYRMFMAQVEDQDPRGMFLHDASTNRSIPVGPRSARPVHAWGKRAVCALPVDDIETVFVADLPLGEGESDARP